jgi:outer membrane biosynthesis protein TonB
VSRFSKEDKAGLYITVIFHLAVLIVLLATQLGFSIAKENSFVLDFTKQEEAEKTQKEEVFKEDISERIERMLSAAGSIPIRNIAVDRGALKDDRGTNAEELYKDAERLQQELNNGAPLPKDELVYEYKKTESGGPKKSSESSYSGPSVVSWELEGRKASRLPIPAYRCMGAGMVTVIISVDPQGNVINAKVEDALSSPDGCLRNFAIRAARLSKFSASSSAPPKQIGNIVYQFIAQ